MGGLMPIVFLPTEFGIRGMLNQHHFKQLLFY